MIRFADIVLSIVGLCLAALPMIVVAITIHRHDHGPAFFYQMRVGKDLRPFKIIKFRTMHTNAAGAGTGPDKGDDTAAKKAARAAFKTTTPNDPRITLVGRKIRATHLDELPQLINVIKGDMSLVGVRPDTPAQEVDYAPEYWAARHKLRPGLTGPAQIAAKGGDLAERTCLEKEWLRNPTIAAYLLNLIGTVRKVMSRSSF